MTAAQPTDEQTTPGPGADPSTAAVAASAVGSWTVGGRLSGADGVRAIACLMVVFSHLFQKLDLPAQQPWLQDLQAFAMKGAFGVSVFFVLSGMLLSLPFWRAYAEGGQYPHLGRYVRRRAARIVPGYYASLLVSVGIGLLILPEAPHVLRRLVAGLTFTSGFHYVTFFPAEANGPLWSIGLEVVSYVLMPAAMMLLFAWRRRGAARAALWWVGVLALTLAVNQAIITWLQTDEAQKGWQYGVVGGAKEWMPWYNPVGFFGHFMLGIAAAGLIVFVGRWQAGRQSRWFDLGALGFLLAVVVLLWARRSPPEPDLSFSLQGQPYFFPVFPALVAGLLVCTAGSTVVGRVLDNRFARYTAKVSFGIYLWHYLVLAVVEHLTGGRFAGYWGIANPVEHLMFSAAILTVSYAIASASWYLLEKPVLTSRWARA